MSRNEKKKNIEVQSFFSTENVLAFVRRLKEQTYI